MSVTIALRRLVTIPISHYCEKARWALERAGLDYVEERHVQGIHRSPRGARAGRHECRCWSPPEGVFAQSEWIVRYADAHLPPEQRLFPATPRSRRCAAGSTTGSAPTPGG